MIFKTADGRVVNPDILQESPFSICRAPLKLPGKPSESSIRDMIRFGRKSVSGDVIQLEICFTTSGMATSLAAFERFLAKLNGNASGVDV